MSGSQPAGGGDEQVAVSVDLHHGGRWTSLRHGPVEWLWRRDAPDRSLAAPGSAFVDAGGLEECFPTIRGIPDHGDVWCRPWTGDDRRASVETAAFSLTRNISVAGATVTVDYTLMAPPRYPFVWAGHLLLDVSERARLEGPGGAPVRVFKAGETWVRRVWPEAGGLRLDRLGPDDGTAVSAVAETPAMGVRDDARRLDLAVEAPGQPTAVGIWRNLRGWPRPRPYRSIGVEPMLGLVWDRAAGRPGDTAVTGADGRAEWRMTLRLG